LEVVDDVRALKRRINEGGVGEHEWTSRWPKRPQPVERVKKSKELER
jgi:hypothetical protein